MLDKIILAIKKANTILKMLEDTLKWHWKIIILLSFCGLVYWMFTLPPPFSETPNPVTYIIENGDTIGDIINNDTLYYTQP